MFEGVNGDEARGRITGCDGPPVFVVGMPRSGTTLMARLLASSGPYVALPESHFFSRFVWTSIHRRREPSLREAWATFARSLRWPVCSVLDPQIRAGDPWCGSPARYRAVFLAWVTSELRARAVDRAKSSWVENSPPHLEGLPFILRLFTEAKVIGMIRDPRAVQASLEHVDWNRVHPAANAVRWAWYAARLRAYEAELPDRLRVVSYERLVAEPHATLAELVEWLELPLDADANDAAASFSAGGFDPREEPWKVMALGRPDPARIHAWREVLRHDDVASVERWAGHEMARNGYEVALKSTRPSGCEWFAAQRMRLRLASYAAATAARVAAWRPPATPG